MYVSGAMAHISIRDLQKMSSETIAKLSGPTPVKSGGQTVAILTPIRKPDLERLGAALTLAEELAKGRDAAADDAALAQYGEVDPTNWNEEAIRKLYQEG